MNPVIELLNARHGTRSISQEPLEQRVIDDLVEAARLSPSCYNNQPWRFIFVHSPEELARTAPILAEGNRVWAQRAPLLVIGTSREEDDCTMPGRTYNRFDLGLAVMNIMLAATAHDLVARPMAGFSPKKTRQLFQLDPADDPLIILAIGRPSDDESHLPDHARGKAQQARERKPPQKIVSHR